MPWDRFLIQVSYKYTQVPPVTSPRPLSASLYKLTARFPLQSMLLPILLPRSPIRTAKESACLSHPCFYNPILLWEDLWRNKGMTCPPSGPGEPVLLLGGEAELPPPVLCLRVPKSHYGYEAVSLYCFASWKGINAAGFGRTKETSVVLWSMTIDLTLISKKNPNLLEYWNYI